jgi:ketosteroid isomerase-like protein
MTMSNSRETLQIATALMAAWENRDLNATARLLGDSFQLTGPAPAALGKQEYLGFQAIHNEGFADWQFNPKEVRVDGDTAYVTFQITATHTGAWDVSKLGLPVPAVAATGKHRAWPVEHMTVQTANGVIQRLEVSNEPEGGVAGTLAWLGVRLPEGMAAPAL